MITTTYVLALFEKVGSTVRPLLRFIRKIWEQTKLEKKPLDLEFLKHWSSYHFVFLLLLKTHEPRVAESKFVCRLICSLDKKTPRISFKRPTTKVWGSSFWVRVGNGKGGGVCRRTRVMPFHHTVWTDGADGATFGHGTGSDDFNVMVMPFEWFDPQFMGIGGGYRLT